MKNPSIIVRQHGQGASTLNYMDVQLFYKEAPICLLNIFISFLGLTYYTPLG